MKKVLLLCVTSQDIYNFRMPLIKSLLSQGCVVAAVAFDNAYENELAIDGLRLFFVKNSNRDTNPFSMIRLKREYKRIIREIEPDIVLTFMAKPNTVGVLAAKECGIKNVFCVVEGAGEAFGDKSFKMRVIKRVLCSLYKRAFRFAQAVFFLNDDDMREFISLKILEPNKAKRINGVGVDLEKFSFVPFEQSSDAFVMAARMLKTKGVIEYCECAKRVKEHFPSAIFYYLGSKGDLDANSIKEYIDSGVIDYRGNVKDVRPYFSKSIAFVLPSYYREGLPMSIMEAESMGRCIITSDSVGCRDTVKDGLNGFLVEPKNSKDLADKCMLLLNNKELAKEMGLCARKYAEQYYDQKIINELFLSYLGF